MMPPGKRPIHFYDGVSLVPCGTDEPNPGWSDSIPIVTCHICRRVLAAREESRTGSSIAVTRAPLTKMARHP
jgi:hypothetical protein